jgi:hypothetical protein
MQLLVVSDGMSSKPALAFISVVLREHGIEPAGAAGDRLRCNLHNHAGPALKRSARAQARPAKRNIAVQARQHA